MAGLLILVLQAQKATRARSKEILDLYLANTARVNNWDLVDASAPGIVGHAIIAGAAKPSLLRRLARSSSLWERRIAIVATQTLIRAGEFGPTLDIATRLLDDEHDLIHKATGWMLREVGNRSRETLEGFLAEHAARMPRTALRYAIERFEPAERARYLAIKRAR
jgi:3-methyladenine DNA glycosylase AlkD